MKKLSFDEKLTELRKYYLENSQKVDYEVSVCLNNIKEINNVLVDWDIFIYNLKFHRKLFSIYRQIFSFFV